MWVYGSGFPKSHDVSKAIDKLDAKDEQKQRQYKFTAWVRSQNVTAKQIDEATGTFMGSHYTTDKAQPAVMTREHLEQCRHLFAEVPEWVEHEADKRSVESKNFAEREILEAKHNGKHGGTTDIMKSVAERNYNITAPATDAAKEWNGWGTALKPAHEPICVARKPLIGTVAENVLEHGTGALNIDGCRVHGTTETNEFDIKRTGYKKGAEHISRATPNEFGQVHSNIGVMGYKAREHNKMGHVKLGRWPANLIHDGSAEVLAGFPETGPSSSAINLSPSNSQPNVNFVSGSILRKRSGGYDEPRGSASRFFYCAKASKRDRDEGCGGLEAKNRFEDVGNKWTTVDYRDGHNRDVMARNHHPTVKPTDLMRYLCRLVTPPNGLILDPFTGSGSTGKAAILEGFRFVGFEMETQYIEIATVRIEWALEQKTKQNAEQENTLFGASNE